MGSARKWGVEAGRLRGRVELPNKTMMLLISEHLHLDCNEDAADVSA